MKHLLNQSLMFNVSKIFLEHNKMKHFLRSILLIFATFFVQTIYAWNFLGHMVVADIAYQNLNREARREVDNLVECFKQEYPYMNTFMHLAYWPDTIRSQRIETFTHWHYVDIPFSQDGTTLKNKMDTDNSIWAMNSIKVVTNNKNANVYERARFLAFFIHILGDLHQPLHTVSRYSAKYPNGDAGGNLFYIRYDNKQVKLHQFWDEGLGTFTGEATVSHVNEIAKKISALYPPSYFDKNKINDADPEHWAKEGMQNAKGYVYNTPENQTPDSHYVERGRQLVEQQVALAGYRGAAILNQMLGK